jgi:hypothetical protein
LALATLYLPCSLGDRLHQQRHELFRCTANGTSVCAVSGPPRFLPHFNEQAASEGNHAPCPRRRSLLKDQYCERDKKFVSLTRSACPSRRSSYTMLPPREKGSEALLGDALFIT